MTSFEELARQFEADRPHLRSVAFHLLGSSDDADDAVQSAWLKASRADAEGAEGVANLTGWFTTITAHVAVDQLRTRHRRAELPLTGTGEFEHRADLSAAADEEVVLADAVGRALLVVLDRLSPAQRVAYVLHDVFGLPFETIAELLDRSTDSAKKLASRARRQLRSGAPTATRRTAEHLEIAEAFVAASRDGDMRRLLELLAPDVVRRVDRVLVPADVPTEVVGAAQVAEETRRFTRRARAGVVLLIDGAPGIAIAPRGRLQALLCIGIGDHGRIHTIDIIGTADRLEAAVLTLPG